MNYRNEARRALQRANDHLDDPGISRGRYAALELRMALESLVYERADSYREELPGRALYTWQPGKLLKMLLEIDPLADKSSSLSIGEEVKYGEYAPRMRFLGHDRVLTLKEIKRYYDRLGSYLHAPTREQVDSEKRVSDEKIVKRCRELTHILDEVLASPVFNLDFRVTSKIQCEKCESMITRRLPSDGEKFVAKCISCLAEYDVVLDKGGKAIWTPRVEVIGCGNPNCNAKLELWNSEIKVGTNWLCSTCGGRNVILLGLQHQSSHEDT